jgi:hypothetical protein
MYCTAHMIVLWHRYILYQMMYNTCPCNSYHNYNDNQFLHLCTNLKFFNHVTIMMESQTAIFSEFQFLPVLAFHSGIWWVTFMHWIQLSLYHCVTTMKWKSYFSDSHKLGYIGWYCILKFTGYMIHITEYISGIWAHYKCYLLLSPCETPIH